MAKEIIITQYIEVRRKVAVLVEEGEDVAFARDVVDGLPLNSANISVQDDNVRIVRDWDYIQDSDNFEDEDGDPI